LAKEMPGVLRWAVEGCMKWQTEGLRAPEAVKAATAEYREDMDILGPFIDENCAVYSTARVEAKLLYENYTKWCYQNNEMDLKNRAFYRQLEIRGFKKEKGSKNKTFIHGMTLNEFAGASLFSGEEKEEKDNITPIKRKKV
ncbi:primase-like DNA-binding domain-containing protein, partial [Bacillus toyonensis]|uniref:primase-like DNA-binding domain-containing protein n=1 Tax=Bacillus toyonensis TaxID=155322 RepID=UPI002FFF32DD